MFSCSTQLSTIGTAGLANDKQKQKSNADHSSTSRKAQGIFRFIIISVLKIGVILFATMDMISSICFYTEKSGDSFFFLLEFAVIFLYQVSQLLHLKSKTHLLTHLNPLCFSQVFPHGLPEEFTLIFTLALKKAALSDTIYLFQISDEQGYPQVFLILCFLIHFSSSFSSPLTLFLDLSPFIHHTFCLLTLTVAHFSSAQSCTFLFDLFLLVTPLQFSPPFIPGLFCPSLILLPLSRSLPLCHLPSIIFPSPLSCTFIVIHVCSVMKHWSP